MEEIKNNNNFDIDRKKHEAYLLYGQALDIHRSYYQEFGDKLLNGLKEKYFLVDKNWLDYYKSVYDYNSIIQDAEQYQYDDYETFKSKISNRLKNNNKKALKIESPKLEQELLSDYEILIPKNFVIVKREIFESYFLKFDLSYDIIIGEKNIFIFDKQKENSKYDNLFICSIQYNEYSDDITDFYVNVDYILILNKGYDASEEKKIFFKLIKNGQGVKHYLKEKKLNIRNYGVQNIFRGNNKKEVGVFYNIRNKKNTSYENKISELFANEYLKKKFQIEYNPNLNENSLNSLDRHSVSINRNKSKCITIYGNLYYYLREDNNENNFSISEYRNINQFY